MGNAEGTNMKPQPQDAREKELERWLKVKFTQRDADAFRLGFDAGYNAARRDDWVRVEDGLPTKLAWYLTTSSDGEVSHYWWDGKRFCPPYAPIIAWQKYPEPYTAGDEKQ